MAKQYETLEQMRAQHRRYLNLIELKFGYVVPVTFQPSLMWAGPCDSARVAASIAHDTSTQHLPPFDDCSHPERCSCMFTVGRDD